MLFFNTINEFLSEIKQQNKTTIPLFHILSFADVGPDTPTVMPPYQMNFFQISFIESSQTSRIKLNTSQDSSIDKTVYFVSPEHVFSWKWERDVNGFLIFFDKSFLDFSRIILEEEFYELFDFRKENILTLTTEECKELLNIFNKMYTDYHTESPFQTQILQSNILSLLFKLKHIYLQKEAKTWRPLSRTETTYKAFQNLIKNSFIGQKSVKFYADKLCIGPNYLNEICKKTVQKSAKQLIQDHVLSEAKKRLIYSTEDIAEIGFQLGYKEATHFVRFFKRQTGITPNGFRKLKENI